MLKSILITGASSGIGKATAINLAKNNYKVFAGVRNDKDLKMLQTEKLDNLTPVILDVTKPDLIDAVHNQIVDFVGEQGLFALINNAGVNYVMPFELCEERELRKLMEVNVFGAIHLSQKFFSLLQKYKISTGQNSHIINIGSIGSVVGLPWQYIYHVSKFAIYGFTKSLRIELDKLGIKASCVLPGSVETPIFDKTASGIDSKFESLSSINKGYYKKSLENMSGLAVKFRAQALKPEKVGELICKMLEKQNPKVKNVIGLDARLMNFMELYLPSWLSIWIVKSLMVK